LLTSGIGEGSKFYFSSYTFNPGGDSRAAFSGGISEDIFFLRF